MSSPRSFFPDYYLKSYPDVAQSAYGTLEGAKLHYSNHGHAEGRSPNPFFVPRFYLQKYQDLANAFGADYRAALEHWLNHGITEGRQGSPFFDPAFYLRNHNDLIQAFGPAGYEAACNHWIEHGMREGRRSVESSPTPLFEPSIDMQLSKAGSDGLAPALAVSGIAPTAPIVLGYIIKKVIEKAIILIIDIVTDRPRPPKNGEDMRPLPVGPPVGPPGDYPDPPTDKIQA